MTTLLRTCVRVGSIAIVIVMISIAIWIVISDCDAHPLAHDAIPEGVCVRMGSSIMIAQWFTGLTQPHDVQTLMGLRSLRKKQKTVREAPHSQTPSDPLANMMTSIGDTLENLLLSSIVTEPPAGAPIQPGSREHARATGALPLETDAPTAPNNGTAIVTNPTAGAPILKPATVTATRAAPPDPNKGTTPTDPSQPGPLPGGYASRTPKSVSYPPNLGQVATSG
jgi:hypothetical protein